MTRATQEDRRVTVTARRAWLLANPRAGRGVAGDVATAIARRLRDADIAVVVDTRHPADVPAPEVRPDVVIVVGGDGTLRAAVERLMRLYPDDVPAVLPVPMGTANLMGQHLGLRRTLSHIAADGVREAASELLGPRRRLAERAALGVTRRLGTTAKRLARRGLRVGRRVVLPGRRELASAVARRTLAALQRGEARRLDVGMTSDGGVFLLMAGVGFDAHVVAELDRRRTGPIGLASYAMPALSAMVGGAFRPVTVEVDGRRVFGPQPGLVMVANVSQYGTGFPVVPHARSDDGKLDAVCLPCRHPGDLLKLFASAAAGWHVDAPGVVSASGVDVTVTSSGERPVDVQIDGDPGGKLPLRARVLPAAVPFVSLTPRDAP